MTGHNLPSPERLRELFDYDPETGALTWKDRGDEPRSSRHACLAGRPAGTLRAAGFIAVSVFGRKQLAHRVIWAIVYGAWPRLIRHRNGKLADNRLKNLVACSQSAIQRHSIAKRKAAAAQALGPAAAKARRKGERKRDRLGL